MFSREDSKRIREQFWTEFGKQSRKKWILYNTKIKEVSLKFHFDNKKASLGFLITTEDEILKPYYFEKFTNLKALIKEEINNEIVLEEFYETEIGEILSYIYLEKQEVSIHNKKTWPEIFDFFNTQMPKFESFFLSYKDFIED
ncbi:DUF4268 domain-containing protein [Mesonia aestuariivivens]|uniref:DUF4268 domain-containing protein n=1 Tax=Mesonia aestuariivivens TaxID=2796128 RepID=A0ABS6W0J5_9FLAO|nr:DUF4268 domain-containing protein [Mesonia aestuariivivens]MBW2961342.1 DUF4268 domain-containing protein [Mesonia aestuariivivens]